MLLKEEKLLYQDSLKQISYEIASWGTKNHVLSEAALHESGLQRNSQRMEFHQANRLSDFLEEKRIGYAQKWTEEKEFFKRICMRKKWNLKSCAAHGSNWGTTRQIRGHRDPNFEMLDSKIASVLNTYFKKKVSLEERKAQMEDRFRSGKQIAHLINEYFRVTGAHEVFLDYSDLFSIASHGDDIQDFETRWDEVFWYQSVKFSMTRFWTVCTRCEYERLINSKQYWLCTNKKSIKIKSKLGYQNLKTMVKRHVDQKIRTRRFQARTERVERGVLDKTQKREDSALKGTQENAVSGKQKDSVQREMHAASATISVCVDK